MESNCVFSGKAGLSDLHNLRQLSEQALKKQGIDEETCANLVVAIDEWTTNIVNYGYQGKKGEIELLIYIANNQVNVCIRDQGPAFDITSTDPVKPTGINSPDRKPGGLGIELIRRLTDSMEYTRSNDDWNETCFRKNLSS